MNIYLLIAILLVLFFLILSILKHIYRSQAKKKFITLNTEMKLSTNFIQLPSSPNCNFYDFLKVCTMVDSTTYEPTPCSKFRKRSEREYLYRCPIFGKKDPITIVDGICLNCGFLTSYDKLCLETWESRLNNIDLIYSNINQLQKDYISDCNIISRISTSNDEIINQINHIVSRNPFSIEIIEIVNEIRHLKPYSFVTIQSHEDTANKIKEIKNKIAEKNCGLYTKYLTDFLNNVEQKFLENYYFLPNSRITNIDKELLLLFPISSWPVGEILAIYDKYQTMLLQDDEETNIEDIYFAINKYYEVLEDIKQRKCNLSYYKNLIYSINNNIYLMKSDILARCYLEVKNHE